MTDSGPTPAGIDVHQDGKRYSLARQRRLDVDAVERVEAILQFGRHLQDDPIGIELSKILGDLPLAIGVVERVVDRLRRDAEARGLIAIDRDSQARRIRQQVG